MKKVRGRLTNPPSPKQNRAQIENRKLARKKRMIKGLKQKESTTKKKKQPKSTKMKWFSRKKFKLGQFRKKRKIRLKNPGIRMMIKRRTPITFLSISRLKRVFCHQNQ